MLRRLMMAVNAASDPTGAAIKAKLTSWWEMDEASGTRYDSKGTNHLTQSGTVGTATGVRGSGDVAASFNGSSWLYVSSNSTIQVASGGGDHCLFGWVYVNVNSGIQIFAAKTDGSGSPNLEYAMSMQGGTYYGQNGGSAYYNASQTAPAAGAWHFVVVWRDSADGKVRMQIDNGTVNVSASTSNPSPKIYQLAFGINGASASGYLTGRQQRCGWIKGAILTAGERTWLYNSGAGRKYSEL